MQLLDKPTSPLPGRCQKAAVVCKATITPQVLTNNNKVETYTGLPSRNFKKGHYGHDHDMKEENKDETGTSTSSERLARTSTSPGTCSRRELLATTQPAGSVVFASWRNST